MAKNKFQNWCVLISGNLVLNHPALIRLVKILRKQKNENSQQCEQLLNTEY